MAEPRIDARIDYYRVGNPYAETKTKTRLNGVRIGNVGKQLKIGEDIRVWVGVDPEKEPLAYNLRLAARISDGLNDPSLMLLGEHPASKRPEVIFIPQSAILRGRYGAMEFGETQPIKTESLKFGQIIEGFSPDGKAAAFVVGCVKEGNNRPYLVALAPDPERLDLTVRDDGRSLKAGRFRLLGSTIQDWTRGIVQPAEASIPSPA